MRDLLVIAITALASASAGAFVTLAIADKPQPLAEPADIPRPADVDELLERIAALEEQLSVDLPRTVANDVAAEPRSNRRTEPAPPVEPDAGPPSSEDRFQQREQQRRDRMETRLRDAGWSDAEIASLEQVQDEARLLHEQRQFEALRKMAKENDGMMMFFDDQRSAMRESMGDQRYEQYLDALGRPVSVEIRDVLPGSSGETAGLRPGDQILRYGSERVYSEQDLMRAMIDGEPGEFVTLEIERDGTTMHVTVPRGPLGTSRGRGPF